jgi:D-methionine transport system permease protein
MTLRARESIDIPIIAIRYGYQRFNARIMIATIAIVTLIVQFVQLASDKLARYVTE